MIELYIQQLKQQTWKAVQPPGWQSAFFFYVLGASIFATIFWQPSVGGGRDFGSIATQAPADFGVAAAAGALADGGPTEPRRDLPRLGLEGGGIEVGVPVKVVAFGPRLSG